jgi:hypothetical protein
VFANDPSDKTLNDTNAHAIPLVIMGTLPCKFVSFYFLHTMRNSPSKILGAADV